MAMFACVRRSPTDETIPRINACNVPNSVNGVELQIAELGVLADGPVYGWRSRFFSKVVGDHLLGVARKYSRLQTWQDRGYNHLQFICRLGARLAPIIEADFRILRIEAIHCPSLHEVFIDRLILRFL